MREHSQNFSIENDESNNFSIEDESDATLASPRFDAADTRHAHPVVPLDAVRARPYGAKARTTLRSLQRSWPLTALVVALLAVVAVGGGLAIHRAHRTPDAPASSPASPPASSDAAPVQQSDAQAHPDAAPTAATATHEGAQAEHDTRPSRDARGARDERAEESPAPVEVARSGGEDSKGEDEGRRDHTGRDKHRRHEGDGEKEVRKSLKHGGKYAARLVDVITGPPR